MIVFNVAHSCNQNFKLGYKGFNGLIFTHIHAVFDMWLMVCSKNFQMPVVTCMLTDRLLHNVTDSVKALHVNVFCII